MNTAYDRRFLRAMRVECADWTDPSSDAEDEAAKALCVAEANLRACRCEVERQALTTSVLGAVALGMAAYILGMWQK